MKELLGLIGTCSANDEHGQRCVGPRLCFFAGRALQPGALQDADLLAFDGDNTGLAQLPQRGSGGFAINA
jgi:hypothetical protein